MSSHNGCWTFSADLPRERPVYRLRLPLFRNTANPGARAQQTAAGDGKRLRRDVRKCAEVPLPDLLPPAGLIEGHAAHHIRVLKIGDGRIVERDVSVLPKSNKSEVDWSCLQKSRVPPHFHLRIGGIALNVVHPN